MVQRHDIGLVLLHGLPAKGEVSPFIRLNSLRQDLESLISPANIFSYEWLKDLKVDPLRPALFGRLGQSCRSLASSADSQIRGR